MPYIPKEDRDRIYSQDKISCEMIDTPGELNFSISVLALRYLENHGMLSYKAINDVVGAMECAKHELYQRLVAKYEDKKLAENGDLWYESVLGDDI